jgi:hypothetical protein
MGVLGWLCNPKTPIKNFSRIYVNQRKLYEPKGRFILLAIEINMGKIDLINASDRRQIHAR